METSENKMVIQISGEEDTPQILIDTQKNYIKIKGASFPEDAFETYLPILEWIKSVDKSILKELIIDLDFSILSSASNKMVYEILLKLESFYHAGIPVKMNWFCERFDEDLFEEGKNYRESIVFPVNIVFK